MPLRPTFPAVASRAASGRLRTLAAIAVLALAGAFAAATWAAADANAATRKAALRLRSVTVRDTVAGMNAFRMLVPVGWRVRGGMSWDLRYHTLTSATLDIRSPSGREAVQSYPIFPHVWDSQGIFSFPQGSIYLGAVVQPPMTAVSYLERLVVPTYRGGVNPRVVARVSLPNVAKKVSARAGNGFGTSARFDAGRVRIAYRQGGRDVEEDFYTLLSYSTTPALPTRVSWAPYSLYSFRSTRGSLKRYQSTLQTMVASVRADVRWYAAFLGVQKQWVDGQMRSIAAAGELSRRISANNDQITESLRSSYKARQTSSDRISDSFSEQIRGVETYQDPFAGRAVQLPSDYSYAWASSSGEYAFSNSAGFNPNVGSTTEWRLLKTT